MGIHLPVGAHLLYFRNCFRIRKLILLRYSQYILAVGQNTVVFFFRTYHNLFELTLTGTGRNQVTADNVLLHTFQTVYLSVDSSLVEDLRRFLGRKQLT